MLRLQRAQPLRGHHLRHRAAGVRVRVQHQFFGRQQLRRLRHEVDAAEDHHVDIRQLRRLDAQLQRIAHIVGHGVVQSRLHVVVPEDDRVLFFLEAVDFKNQLRLHGNFHLRNHPFEAGGQPGTNFRNGRGVLDITARWQCLPRLY